MPSADQLKALLRAYAQGDDAQFHSVAMQIAAGEARSGHGKLAEELRELIDRSRLRLPSSSPSPIPLARPRGEVADLLTVSYPKTRLDDLVLPSKTRKILIVLSASIGPSAISARTGLHHARSSFLWVRLEPARR